MDLPRSSGLLLPLTSLPSPYGIGDLGSGAYHFADFLSDTHQRVWQMLPVVPVGAGHSPYSSPSTFAGNPLLISPERLLQEGLLEPEDAAGFADFPAHRVDYDRVLPFKRHLLERAFDRFEDGHPAVPEHALAAYAQDQAGWLDDYALFMALREAHGEDVWTRWPAGLAHRDPDALARAREEHARTVRMHQFWQLLFHRQWTDLRAYCQGRSIRFFGDLPIYVAHNSADVWAHPGLFHLDDAGNPTVVAGVPPDYFSETGQRWGNPLYRWDVMQEDDYAWWKRRLERVFTLFDLVRLDHFRGFEGYWEIPAEEETAVRGRWAPGPGAPFFERMQAQLGRLPIVAEDLGVITEGVRHLMAQFNLPGMAVLQFAFEADADSYFLPHNYQRDLVAYTGTHDNDTLIGWWTQGGGTTGEGVERIQRYALQYLGLDRDEEHEIHWRALRAMMGSVAALVVTPVQDLLGLGSSARMNTPGRAEGNWTWRYLPDQLTADVADRLRTLTRIFGRSPDKRVPV